MEYMAVVLPRLFARISWGIAGILVIIAAIIGVVKFVRRVATTQN